MPLSPEIRDQAYQFFVEEAQELLQIIEMGLLSLRQDSSTAKIHEIMRAAHSLKGGAASVELDAIKTISHRLETIFKALYNDSVILDATLEAALLQGYDCLRLPLETQIEIGTYDEVEALTQAEPVLGYLETLLAEAIQESEGYVPSSEDLGVDIVASIFEVDVVQGLERWATVLADPHEYPVAGEMRAQLEVFAGLSEILGLPGFGKLTETAMAALDQHPDRAVDVLTLALADFQRACSQVLQGDRGQGGAPSAELLALAQSSPSASPATAESLPPPPPLNDIFGEEPFGEERFGNTNQNVEIRPNIPHLETLFSDLPDNTDFYGPLAAAPSLDAVFGDFEIEAEEESIDPEQLANPPSLEAIFGDYADVPDVLDVPSTPDTPDTPSTPDSSTTSTPPSPDRPTLTTTINAAVAHFDQLPSLAEGATGGALTTRDRGHPLVAPSPPTPHPPETTPLKTKPRSQVPSRSMRVDFQRLERMNNLVGELVINRNSLSLQNEQLQTVVRELSNRFEYFQTLLNQLRQSSDLLLVDTARSAFPQSNLAPTSPLGAFRSGLPTTRPSSFPPEATRLTPTLSPSSPTSTIDIEPLAFDYLEMDQYSSLHGQLQEIFEEAIQLEEAVNDINLFAGQSTRSLQQQRQQLNQLQNELMWSRMLPLGEVLNRFPRVLRDLSNRFQKPVNLKLTGASVLIDKSILEKLHDPLLHLLRNAFDHGIESPEIRLSQGKPEEATIEIRAYHRGNQTLIEIQDDGQGINLEKVSRRALDLGWIQPEDLSQLKAERLYGFLFESGFSTATQVTDLSGRGVGLDVVKSEIESLKGSVSITSTPQKGTTFTLRLPLTLTITKLLIIQADQQPLALPSDSLEEIIIPKPEQLKQTGRSLFLHWRNQLIPYYNLQALMQYCGPVSGPIDLPHLVALQAPPDWLLPLLIIRRGSHSFALQVDRILTEQELVVKPFNPAIAPPPYLYGCTVLGNGRLVPVMDGSLLIDYYHEGQFSDEILHQSATLSVSSSSSQLAASSPASSTASTVPSTGQTPGAKRPPVPTILVVDDSAALRRTLALTLQKAGYPVLQARDGQEALEQLQQQQGVGLVICDVEMPNMNGFEFLSQRRRISSLAQIPVFMLTSRSNQKHRQLAQTLGAASYFTKPYLEQELLQALAQLFQS